MFFLWTQKRQRHDPKYEVEHCKKRREALQEKKNRNQTLDREQFKAATYPDTAAIQAAIYGRS